MFTNGTTRTLNEEEAAEIGPDNSRRNSTCRCLWIILQNEVVTIAFQGFLEGGNQSQGQIQTNPFRKFAQNKPDLATMLLYQTILWKTSRDPKK